jgi:PAS domain S-box-containing protein
VRDANGEPLHMLGLVQDITERKQAELGIIESNARLEEAQNQAKLGNWQADMVSGELYWSDEIYRIFGQDKASFSPTFEAFQSTVHPDDRAQVLESEKQAAASGVHDVTHRIILPDGTVRYVHELARAIFASDGRMLRLRGTVQDVTEQKLAEQELVHAKEAAEAASHAKSEFLASISHELRTPLNAILGYSQLFSMDEELPQETRSNSRQIESAGKHLLSLVNGLIDLARIESNKLELSMEAVNLKDVVCDSINMVQSMAHDKGIKIMLLQCERIDIVVLADFNRLRQSLINLLTNAIKYNKPKGTVHVLCEAVGGMAQIAVTDTGAGIPAEMHGRIFNAFDRLGEERGEIEGTGIGLVITKRIVEAMGGKIGFESTVAQGSTFWLEFPVSGINLRAAASAAIPTRRVNEGHQREIVPEVKSAVLYIEDNEMNLRLMQQIIAGRKKWDLSNATTAERGIEMVRANLPRLILMDINLPGMDGYQALSILKADPASAHIPIVALTANAMKGDRERGLQAGFADYLTKPLDIRQLMQVLDKLLD